MPDAEDTMFYCAWLLLHDKPFLHRHRNVDIHALPQGPLRYLADLAQTVYEEHGQPLTSPVLDITLENDASGLRRNRTEAGAVRRVWRDLDLYAVVEEAAPVAREMCSEWLRHRGVQTRMESARLSLDKGAIAEAEEILRRQDIADDREAPLTMADSTFVLASSLLFGSKDAVPTGLPAIDDAWRGGTRPGEIGMIAGPTGLGKSQVLTLMAAACFWKGYDSLLYTFELTREQMIERVTLACLQTGKFDLGRTEDRRFFFDEEKVIQAWARGMRRNRVDGIVGDYSVQGGPLSWPQLREDLEEYREKRGAYPKLLLLDSADDIVMPGKFEKEYESLKSAYRLMRRTAQELKIPIWTTTQFTREQVDKGRVSLKNIGGAYAKAQLCHYILGMAQTPEERQEVDGPVINMYVMKDSLHGSTGAWLQCTAEFGRGENGYAGLNVDQTYGLDLNRRGEPG